MMDTRFELSPDLKCTPNWMRTLCQKFLNSGGAKHAYMNAMGPSKLPEHDPAIHLEMTFTAIIHKCPEFITNTVPIGQLEITVPNQNSEDEAISQAEMDLLEPNANLTFSVQEPPKAKTVLTDTRFELSPGLKSTPNWMRTLCHKFLNSGGAKHAYMNAMGSAKLPEHDPAIHLEMTFTAIIHKSPDNLEDLVTKTVPIGQLEITVPIQNTEDEAISQAEMDLLERSTNLTFSVQEAPKAKIVLSGDFKRMDRALDYYLLNEEEKEEMYERLRQGEMETNPAIRQWKIQHILIDLRYIRLARVSQDSELYKSFNTDRELDSKTSNSYSSNEPSRSHTDSLSSPHIIQEHITHNNSVERQPQKQIIDESPFEPEQMDTSFQINLALLNSQIETLKKNRDMSLKTKREWMDNLIKEFERKYPGKYPETTSSSSVQQPKDVPKKTLVSKIKKPTVITDKPKISPKKSPVKRKSKTPLKKPPVQSDKPKPKTRTTKYGKNKDLALPDVPTHEPQATGPPAKRMRPNHIKTPTRVAKLPTTNITHNAKQSGNLMIQLQNEGQGKRIKNVFINLTVPEGTSIQTQVSNKSTKPQFKPVIHPKPWRY